jgi:hypothetical protein
MACDQAWCCKVHMCLFYSVRFEQEQCFFGVKLCIKIDKNMVSWFTFDILKTTHLTLAEILVAIIIILIKIIPYAFDQKYW